ncbi:exported hypothetical protein [Stenotrophomonas indicatrix]|nr:exported hypothetical protein [Stenotrophomonas indicatrix]
MTARHIPHGSAAYLTVAAAFARNETDVSCSNVALEVGGRLNDKLPRRAAPSAIVFAGYPRVVTGTISYRF